MHNFKQTSNGGFFYSLSTACLVSFEEKAAGQFCNSWWVHSSQFSSGTELDQTKVPTFESILEPPLK